MDFTQLGPSKDEVLLVDDDTPLDCAACNEGETVALLSPLSSLE